MNVRLTTASRSARESTAALVYAHEKDDVFVGRIRRDESIANTLNMWVVTDNLRKGAATNAVQIAEHIVAHVL